jgi:hypothetical protein
MRFFSNVYFSDIVDYLNSPEREQSLMKPKPKKQSDKNDAQADKKEVDTNIPGGELYFMLKDFLKVRLEKIAEVRYIFEQLNTVINKGVTIFTMNLTNLNSRGFIIRFG